MQYSPKRKEAVLRKMTPPHKWQKQTGYNRRSLAETAVFRYKTIIGACLRSRNFESQKTDRSKNRGCGHQQNDRSWNVDFSQSINLIKKGSGSFVFLFMQQSRCFGQQ